MSFLNFKSLVLFIKIVVKLLLLRPFGNTRIVTSNIKLFTMYLWTTYWEGKRNKKLMYINMTV